MINFFINIYHFLLAFFSALFYGFPSTKIKVIGITGTSGKSTVVDLVTSILKEAGYKTAFLSSIKIGIGDVEELNLFKMTMPGRGYTQKFLKTAKNQGCQYAIIEVTSEGILQHRHRFINFNTVIFTNLYPEHIERHGSFENYKSEKGKLFQATKRTHVLNYDDKNFKYFFQFPAKKKIVFTLSDKKIFDIPKGKLRIVRAKDHKTTSEGITFKIDDINFKLKLLGEFNIRNALTAVCVGISQEISIETCKKALEKISGVPGRMEFVTKQPFQVIVDYAHTPEALETIYKTIKNQESNMADRIPNLICVLGSCGGGRDKWKRPKLGEIASRFCDNIIITNEDPYDEPPMEIIEEIFSGVTDEKKGKTKKILNRREAIKNALILARPSDIVIITGKGCEPWMCIENNKKIPWDDRKIVKEEIKNIK